MIGLHQSPPGKGRHILPHDGDIAVLPPAPVEVDRAVVVLEQLRVNGLRMVHEAIDQRFAQQVDKRPCGRIGDGNLQAAILLVVLDVVAGEDEVVFAVSVDDGRRPHGTMDVGIPAHINDVGVLLPVNQIRGGERIQIHLLTIGGKGLGDVNVVPSVVEACFRIGLPAGDDRIHRTISPFINAS